MNLFRVSGNKKVKDRTYWRIGVPREFAEAIQGIDLVCELTEAGLVYRPVSGQSRRPSWARPIVHDSTCPTCDGVGWMLDHVDVFGRENYLRCPSCNRKET